MKRCLLPMLALAFAAPVFAQSEAKKLEEDRKQFTPWEEAVEDLEEEDGFLRLYRNEKEERLLADVGSEVDAEGPFAVVGGERQRDGGPTADVLERGDRYVTLRPGHVDVAVDGGARPTAGGTDSRPR